MEWYKLLHHRKIRLIHKVQQLRQLMFFLLQAERHYRQLLNCQE